MRLLKTISALIFISLIAPLCLLATDVSLLWNDTATNEDGTTIVDLAGYRVYYGNTTGKYIQEKGSGIDAGNVTRYTINDIKDGTWYFAVTAYDKAGQESLYSNELTKTIDGIPNPPMLQDWKSKDEQ